MLKPKKFLISLLSCLLLASCYEMEYEDIEEYYDYFDNTVYLKYYEEDGKTFSSNNASLEDNFLNEKTQENFDEECLVDSEYYSYLAVCLEEEKETRFNELCLYFKAESEALLEIRIYIVDELPSKGRGFNAEQKSDIKKYDDEYSNPVAIIQTSLSSTKFKDIYVKEWLVDGSKSKFITLKPNQYLLMQFYNNTGYGFDEDLKSVKFTMTNFIFNQVGS